MTSKTQPDEGSSKELEAIKATPEQVLNRVREWINSVPVTSENAFGDGYRAALRDIRSQIVNHTHSSRFEPKATHSNLTTQEEDSLWDTLIPPGGKESDPKYTNVEVHKRACLLVSDMLETRLAGYQEMEKQLHALAQDLIDDYNSDYGRRIVAILNADEEVESAEPGQVACYDGARLAKLVNDLIGVAEMWVTSDHPATRTGGEFILKTVARHQEASTVKICELPHGTIEEEDLCDVQRMPPEMVNDPNSVVSAHWLREQYRRIVGEMDDSLSDTQQDYLVAKLLGFRDRQLEMLRQRLALSAADQVPAVLGNDEVEVLRSELAVVHAAAEDFRQQTGEFLVQFFIEGRETR